ncbi:MAG: FG-GAP-like repeat-containing protein [Hellea sp.]
MPETHKKMHTGKLALIWCGIVILIGVLVFALFSAFGALRFWQAEKTPQGETDLAFEAAELPFVHKADLVNSLPFLASAALDIDGDGRDELFLGGGNDQADAMFAFKNERFERLSLNFSKDSVDATHGAASMDIDNDGDTDLFTARESGIWFHENTNGQFGSVKLPLNLADNTTPLSIGFGDINKDGLADMYIAGYIKIGLVQGETIFSDNYGGFSYLFLNEGEGNWRDISKDAGVWRQHNTFLGVFADLDNDKDSDLIIAQDTGRVEMYSNNGDMTFSPIENPSVYSYPMGVAVGDYDNDGLVDLYFSNVGYTLPPAILRGDLKKDDPFNPSYMLFHNDGGLKFSDTSEAMNAAKYGFGWGTVMADMNLDGREDMLAAQNYARFPANDLLQHYPGKILQNYGDIFRPVEKTSGAENPLFGIAPIVSDFNGDGWPDIVWANLDGQSLAYMNKGGERNWIKVRLPNTARSLGARVTVFGSDGMSQTKQLLTSQGLGSDQGRDLIFGLGDAEKANSVSIEFQNGVTRNFESPENGGLIRASAE